MQNKNVNLKYEKGSTTMIVTFVILFIVILLSTFLVYITARRKNQIQDLERLDKTYNGDLQEVYEERKNRDTNDEVIIEKYNVINNL